MAMDKPRSGESHSIIRFRGLNESTSVLNNCIGSMTMALAMALHCSLTAPLYLSKSLIVLSFGVYLSLTITSDPIFVPGCVLADTSSHAHTSNLVSSVPVAEAAASNVYSNQAQVDNSLYYNNYQQQDPYNQGYYDYAADDQSLFPSQEADRYKQTRNHKIQKKSIFSFLSDKTFSARGCPSPP